MRRRRRRRRRVEEVKVRGKKEKKI